VSDILEGQWKQLRGEVKEWWGKLTDDDLDRIGGKRDRLVGTLQEKYGWTKREAEDEIDDRLSELEDAFDDGLDDEFDYDDDFDRETTF
jgi:uncharacterized protein YjbJ (UPF0337 family)